MLRNIDSGDSKIVTLVKASSDAILNDGGGEGIPGMTQSEQGYNICLPSFPYCTTASNVKLALKPFDMNGGGELGDIYIGIKRTNKNTNEVTIEKLLLGNTSWITGISAGSEVVKLPYSSIKDFLENIPGIKVNVREGLYSTKYSGCIDERGDVVNARIRLGTSYFLNGTINLIYSDDYGSTYKKLTIPGFVSTQNLATDTNIILNAFATQLNNQGYVATVRVDTRYYNSTYLLEVSKTNTKGFTLLTSPEVRNESTYLNYSYTLNEQDWGYDGKPSYEGVTYERVIIRPSTCTFGTIEPFPVLEYPPITITGLSEILDGKTNGFNLDPMTLEFDTLENLGIEIVDSAIDFIKDISSIGSFIIETCGTIYNPPIYE